MIIGIVVGILCVLVYQYTKKKADAVAKDIEQELAEEKLRQHK
jgi:biopolymer transport protein ExbB/TolQ